MASQHMVSVMLAGEHYDAGAGWNVHGLWINGAAGNEKLPDAVRSSDGNWDDAGSSRQA